MSEVSEETKASIMALDRDTAFLMCAMLDQLGDDASEALKEIKMLGSLLDEKAKSKLCKRGRDYIAARKRAGEKSSAYLSGRGVKVCKGQIKFGGKKRKDFKGKK